MNIKNMAVSINIKKRRASGEWIGLNINMGSRGGGFLAKGGTRDTIARISR